jgi:Winged helix DNA-binding domain
MSERVLTARELNRAMLARQLLLDRSEKSVTRAMERIAGLQTQYAPSGYIGLWSRMRDFRRPTLTRALERHQAFTGTLMRITIHTVSARDYPLFSEGVRSSRRAAWLRFQGRELDDADMRRVARIVRRALKDGPRRSAELTSIVEAAGYSRIAWTGAGLWLDLVRVPPSATWERRKADLYDRAERWLPATATEEQGMRHLVRRYLGGFGPAPLADVADWAGLTVTSLRPVAERMRLRRFRDEAGGVLLDVPGAPLPDAGTPAPVRFLASWDPTLLASSRRAQLLPEEHRPRIFNIRTPHSLCAFLVDGTVAGSWRFDGERVMLDHFEKLPVRVRREVENEAARLAAWHDS